MADGCSNPLASFLVSQILMAPQLQRQRPPLVLEVANDVHNGDDPQLAHAQPGQVEHVSTPNVLQDVSSNWQSGDVIYEILKHCDDDSRLRQVSKEWKETFDQSLMSNHAELATILIKISTNRASELSFAASHHLIYKHCVQKKEHIVLFIASRVFSSFDLDIAQAIRASKAFEDICLYMNRIKFKFFMTQHISFPHYAFRFSFVRYLRKKKNIGRRKNPRR